MHLLTNRSKTRLVAILLSLLMLQQSSFAQKPVSKNQKPDYAPFIYKGKMGIMDRQGAVFMGPGTFDAHYIVVGNFEAYIVHTDLPFETELLFDAFTGTTLFSGRMDQKCGALRVGDMMYYHFWEKGNSVLYTLHEKPIHLAQTYLRIDPNHQVWSNEFLSGQQVLWALKSDWTYDVLQVGKHFTPLEGLPQFSSYDVVFSASQTDAPKPIGYVLGDTATIDRSFGQEIYGISESDGKVDVFDLDFHKLGTSVYRANEIGKLFGKSIQLRGGMIPPPESRNQVIYATGTPIVLNDTFSLIPDPADNNSLILVNTQDKNTPVLGAEDFDYRYVSTEDDLTALLQIRHRNSGSIFYFDFNGKFFPRGIPMLPPDMIPWKDE